MIFTITNQNSDDFVKEINDLSFQPDSAILLNEFEFNFTNFGSLVNWDELVSFINRRNINLLVINGAFNENISFLYDLTDPKFQNVRVIEWPWLFFERHRDYENRINSQDDIKKLDIKYKFVCLNNKPHFHRCRQMDLLAKYNLIDTNAVSWNSYHFRENYRDSSQLEAYPWMYWSPSIMVLDEMKAPGDWGWSVPYHYHQSFCQLVSEASSDFLFITEKTMGPLSMCKPFIVSSKEGFHKKLKELGFELFEEIFDYSFDSVQDQGLRFEMIAKNLENLNNFSDQELKDIYVNLWPKLKHNRETVIAIEKNIDLWDKEIIALCEMPQSPLAGSVIHHRYLKFRGINR